MSEAKGVGVPYSLAEAKLVLSQHRMNPYHREVMEWLVREIENAVAAERERCAKIAEGGAFLHADSPEARFGRECAAAIRRGY